MEKLNRMLGNGDTFGELALARGKTGQMRQATAIAKEDCHFAILNKANYDVNALKIRES